MRNLLVFILSLLVFGCSAAISPDRIHARHPANTKDFATGVYTDAQCVKLSDDSDNWLFAAKLLGVGGVASISTVWIDNKVAKGVTASVLATSAAFGVAALWMGEAKANKFKEYCEVTDENSKAPETDLVLVRFISADSGVVVDGGVE
jgi:hypothetical protein